MGVRLGGSRGCGGIDRFEFRHLEHVLRNRSAYLRLRLGGGSLLGSTALRLPIRRNLQLLFRCDVRLLAHLHLPVPPLPHILEILEVSLCFCKCLGICPQPSSLRSLILKHFRLGSCGGSLRLRPRDGCSCKCGSLLRLLPCGGSLVRLRVCNLRGGIRSSLLSHCPGSRGIRSLLLQHLCLYGRGFSPLLRPDSLPSHEDRLVLGFFLRHSRGSHRLLNLDCHELPCTFVSLLLPLHHKFVASLHLLRTRGLRLRVCLSNRCGKRIRLRASSCDMLCGWCGCSLRFRVRPRTSLHILLPRCQRRRRRRRRRRRGCCCLLVSLKVSLCPYCSRLCVRLLYTDDVT
mmetsp:Transcript_13428/g.33574  ORF Transcript_13428/g.33574 Transcript_13428/m.33574 type:complete len:345 (-) Transcript_13428:896-1930(-)